MKLRQRDNRRETYNKDKKNRVYKIQKGLTPKQKLFKKYHIDESHNNWESTDDWISVEIYRIMHEGNLPPSYDVSVDWITDFLDKKESDFTWWTNEIMTRKDFGSIYLTSKRLIYTLADQILASQKATI